MLAPQIVGGLLMAGSKPKVPEFVAVDPGKEQKEAIKQNVAAFDEAAALSTKVGQFNQDQLISMLDRIAPGFSTAQAAAGRNINSLLSGEVPVDVQQAVQRNAAFKSLMGGFGGSQAARNLNARDLGLTSLQMIQTGLDAASRWTSQARQMSAGTMDVVNMFMSPQQRLAHQTSERDKKFQHDWMQAQIKAMPDPKMAAIGGAIIKTDDQITSMASSALGSYVGGML